VWLLLAPRDYLSTFLKIGVIAGLAVGIIFAMPELKMPAVTHFIDGTGPVFAGSLFPFYLLPLPVVQFQVSMPGIEGQRLNC
jgi:carbon starvation protein